MAGVLAGLFPAAASAADRFVYVSNGGFAGSNDVSAFRIGSQGNLAPVTGSPFDVPGQTVTEGLAMSPDAKNVYVASFGTNNVNQFSVNANGGLSALAPATVPAGNGANAVNALSVWPDPDGTHLLVGNHGSAVSVLPRNTTTGALSNPGGNTFLVPAPNTNPFAGSFAPDGDNLYVPMENSTELIGGNEQNYTTSYSIAANGTPTPLQGVGGRGVKTGSTNLVSGPNPFGSAITPDGNFLYVSNPEDGPNGRIAGFAVNANGTLSAQLFNIDAAPGNHPLNMAISPDGDHLYVATRVSRTVNAYTINANGTLTAVPGQPFATGATGVDGKGIAITPDGKRLYVSAGAADDRVFGFAVQPNGALIQLANGTGFPTGGNDPDLETIAITPNQPPTAAVTVTPRPAGQPTGFNATGSTDADGNVVRYDWDFGDGTTVANAGPIPNHIYAQAGNFNVTVTITDNEGCSVNRIFTGKATLCNGSVVARATQTFTVGNPTPAAPVPPNSFSRTVSIKFNKKKRVFKGEVVSQDPDCAEDQTVELVKEKGDKRVGTDTTDDANKYSVKKKNAKGKFHVTVPETTLPNGDTCLEATSNTVKAKKPKK